jgi:hypothetical protein
LDKYTSLDNKTHVTLYAGDRREMRAEPVDTGMAREVVPGKWRGKTWRVLRGSYTPAFPIDGSPPRGASEAVQEATARAVEQWLLNDGDSSSDNYAISSKGDRVWVVYMVPVERNTKDPMIVSSEEAQRLRRSDVRVWPAADNYAWEKQEDRGIFYRRPGANMHFVVHVVREGGFVICTVDYEDEEVGSKVMGPLPGYKEQEAWLIENVKTQEHWKVIKCEIIQACANKTATPMQLAIKLELKDREEEAKDLYRLRSPVRKVTDESGIFLHSGQFNSSAPECFTRYFDFMQNVLVINTLQEALQQELFLNKTICFVGDSFAGKTSLALPLMRRILMPRLHPGPW